MWLSELSVRKPVLASVMSLIIVVLGLTAFLSLGVREYPNIDAPVISVQTFYPGASSTVVESRITKLVEDAVAGISGVRFMESESADGRSDITIEFDVKRNIDDAANDVRDRVGGILESLPNDSAKPEISKSSADENVILWLHLASDGMSAMDITDYAKRFISDRFATIDGVARVRIGGAQDKSMRIWLNPSEMAARSISVSDVENALKTQNVELPAGSIESKNIDFTVRLERDYRSPDDFKNLVISRAQNGGLVRLSDIATVEIAPEESKSYFAGNGVPMVGIGIIKQTNSNTLDVIRAVKLRMNELNESLPSNIKLHTAYDSGVFIESAIREVYYAIAITALLVMCVVYFALGHVTPVIVTALTVPISLIGSFVVFYALGYTINLLTLLALVLAIGLVVDDAIVVVENIYRNISKGKPIQEAVINATKEVGFAVLATTVVLVSVFVPIAFMEGQTGKLFTEFSVVLAVSVLISAFVSLSLSPALCAKFASFSGHPEDQALPKYIVLESKYESFLKKCLNHASLSMVVVMALAISCIGLISLMKTEYAPQEDRGTFVIRMKTQEGSSYDKTMESVKAVEERLMKFTETGEFQRLLIKAPANFSSTNNFNNARGTVVLQDWSDRKQSIWYYLKQVRQSTADLSDIRVNPAVKQPFGNSDGEAVQFVISGPSYQELAKWRDVIIAKAAENKGLVDVYHDYFENKPQLGVKVNRDMAYDLGVSAYEINRALDVMLGGRAITTFVDNGEEYRVVVESDKSFKKTPSDIGGIYVRSSISNSLVPLSNLITVSEFADSPVLRHYNRMRSITITADLASGYTMGEALNYLENIVKTSLPDDVVIGYKGESLIFKSGMNAIYGVFALALIIVFLVLAAQFESFVLPAVVMSTAPIAISGALLFLYMFGQTLNIYSEVAMMVLIGVAAKNGILIVEFSNQLRAKGIEDMDAVLQASKARLKPIIMTSMTAVVGALPLLLATGAGSESRFVIGIVMFFGLLVSTFVTIFVVPSVYMWCTAKKS